MKIFTRSLFSVLLTLPFALQAQLTADAGNDKTLCSGADNYIAVQLGSSPTASGGTGPYTYTWETRFFYQMGNFTITQYASDFLNDTTSANPVVVWGTFNNTPLNFKLTITDANNQTAVDSTLVSFSSWVFTNDFWEFHILQGDSIYLNSGAGAFSNYPPFDYLWRPSHGITDSVHETFWAAPDTSVIYNVTITDAMGCRIDEMARYHVYVSPVSVEAPSTENTIRVFPIPARQELNFRLNQQKATKFMVQIYDLTGKQIMNSDFHSLNFSIDVSRLQPGIYTYRLSGNGAVLMSEKFEIQ